MKINKLKNCSLIHAIINTIVYEGYPPWKRLATGNKLLLFKKIRQKLMKVDRVIEYSGIGKDVSRA